LSTRWKTDGELDGKLSGATLQIQELTPFIPSMEKPTFKIHIDEDDKACLPTGIPVAMETPAAKPAATPAAKPVAKPAANPIPGAGEELHAED
jgi:hypothetical protein